MRHHLRNQPRRRGLVGRIVTIDQCTVTSVRNPQNVTQLVPYSGTERGNDRSILVPQTVSQTISVSLNCSP